MAILCQCHGVSERQIRRAIRHGARDVDEVGQSCRAGTCCGSCWPSIRELLDEAAETTVVPSGGYAWRP